MLTALIAVVARSDVLTRVKVAGGLLSFAGVAIVVAAGPGLGFGGGAGLVPLGDVLTLGAAVLWWIYVAFGAPILRRHSPVRTSAWAMVGGCLVLLLPGLWQASSTSWAAVDGTAWAGLLYSAILAAGLANVLVFNAIRLLGPTRVTAFQFLVPFIAVILGALLLGERVRPEQVVGGIVIVLGVMLTRGGERLDIAGWLRGLFPD